MASFLTSMRKSGSSGRKAPMTRRRCRPAVETWDAPLLEACSAVAGCDLHYVEAPTALDHAQGPWAFGTRLGGGAPDRRRLVRSAHRAAHLRSP